jgi:hypothetical protein
MAKADFDWRTMKTTLNFSEAVRLSLYELGIKNWKTAWYLGYVIIHCFPGGHCVMEDSDLAEWLGLDKRTLVKHRNLALDIQDKAGLVIFDYQPKGIYRVNWTLLDPIVKKHFDKCQRETGMKELSMVS